MTTAPGHSDGADPPGRAADGATASMRPRRATCARCRRPLVVCYCAYVPDLPTRTRILLLQHAREQHMAIGTARMAHLSLPNSVLRVGVDFANDEIVTSAISGEGPVYVLFPGPGAQDVATLPQGKPVTLVVVDGTWSQARKLLKLNPAVAALPRVAFSPRRPSNYRIRRQPAEFCVSTIEALAEVLELLEPGGEPGRFDRLLDPFAAMVKSQERFASDVNAHRHQHAANRRFVRARAKPTLPDRLVANWSRIVCVQGEANAWSRRDPARQDPEIVHWSACRLATGELYDTVIAPRRPLGPGTAAHVDLSVDRLRAGETASAWRQSWNAFLRPGDLVVQWGVFYRNVAQLDDVRLPEPSLDLRAQLSQMLHQKLGTVEDCARRLSAPLDARGIEGRAGRRLSALVGILRVLCAAQAGQGG